MTKYIFLFVQLIGLLLSTPTIFHAQWVQANGPYGGAITALLTKSDTVIAGINGGFHLSTDNGLHWVQTDIMQAYIYSLATDGSNIFAATGLGVSRSTDRGMSWFSASHGLTSSANSFAFLDAKIFASTGHGVFVSSDAGTNWVRSDTVKDGIPSNGTSAITVCDTNIIVGCSMGVTGVLTSRIARSYDKGRSWTLPDTGVRSDYIPVLITLGKNIFAGTTEGGTFRSTIESRCWNSATTGMDDRYVRSLVTDNSNIFAGTPGGVYLSTNNGNDWKKINQGLSDTTIMSLAVNGKYLFAGTEGSGVWRRSLSELTSVRSLSDELPERFTLSQNFPNPFNPNTMISFQLPVSGKILLRVYNQLGQEVASLTDGFRQAGRYKLEWNASGFPSGVYFYRLQVGSFAETKKLILLK